MGLTIMLRYSLTRTLAIFAFALGLTLIAGQSSPAVAGDNSADVRENTIWLARDLFERRIFEPYLRFSSEADRIAFRQREREHKRYIDAQLAKNTPEGNYNASTGIVAYVLDAKDHGADRSPDWRGFSQ
jgi:hypothetical protein